ERTLVLAVTIVEREVGFMGAIMRKSLLSAPVCAPIVVMVAALAAGASCNTVPQGALVSVPPEGEPAGSFGVVPLPDPEDGGVVSVVNSNAEGVVSGAPVGGDFSSCTQEALAAPSSDVADGSVQSTPPQP